MKALTICQPYAHLIAIGEKRVENRSWYTGYRGRLAIHAGKSRAWMPGNAERGMRNAAFGSEAQARRECGIENPKSEIPNPKSDDLVFGAVIAVAELIDCIDIADIRVGMIPHDLHWLKTHEHVEGPYCLVLRHIRRLARPVPFRGAQGFFEIDDQLIQNALSPDSGPAFPTARPPLRALQGRSPAAV